MLREALKVALICVVALTAMMFVGMSVSLMRSGVNVIQLGIVLPYVAAFSLPYALPAACLLASVFVFGRLSANNEITALKSSGINLNHVIAPLLMIGLVVSIFTFTLNHYLLPWSMVRIKQMRERLITDVVQMVGGTYREYEVGNYLVFVGDIDERMGQWRNMAVMEFDGEFPTKILTARRGQCRVDEKRSVAMLELFEGTAFQPRLDSADKQPPVKFDATTFEIDLSKAMEFSSDRPKYLPFSKLRNVLLSLEEKAAEIRAMPRYAEAKHPKSQRKAATKVRDRAWRAYSIELEVLDSASTRAAEVKKLVETSQSEARAARAALDAANKRLEDAKDALVRHREQERRLRRERKSLIEKNASPSRIRESDAEIKQTAARTGELEQRLKTAEKGVSDAQAKLKPIEDTLAVRKAALEGISVEVASARVKADQAAAAYNETKEDVNNLRVLENDLQARTEYHFRNAGALTALIFMLIGIPLGIISRHGNVILAFVISFFVVLIIYYPLMVIGQMLARDGYLVPVIGEWMGNVVVGGAGIALLIKGVRR